MSTSTGKSLKQRWWRSGFRTPPSGRLQTWRRKVPSLPLQPQQCPWPSQVSLPHNLPDSKTHRHQSLLLICPHFSFKYHVLFLTGNPHPIDLSCHTPAALFCPCRLRPGWGHSPGGTVGHFILEACLLKNKFSFPSLFTPNSCSPEETSFNFLSCSFIFCFCICKYYFYTILSWIFLKFYVFHWIPSGKDEKPVLLTT